MKKLFTSTLLTVVAVPFLMAAPAAVKKAKTQNQPQASAQTQTTTVAKSKVHKKRVKKAAKNTSSNVENTAAPSVSSPKQ